MDKDEIYLDNAATTRPSPGVCEAVLGAMREQYGNPSSLHAKGLEAERLVEAARKQVAQVFGAAPEDLYFTAGIPPMDIGRLNADP